MDQIEPLTRSTGDNIIPLKLIKISFHVNGIVKKLQFSLLWGFLE